MLLAVDIGNTNVTLGIFQGVKEAAKPGRVSVARAAPAPALVQSWRLATSASFTSDEYGTKILDLLHYATVERSEIRAIAIASVVPPLDPVFEDLALRYFRVKPFFIDEKAKTPLANLYDNPREVGADRLVNAAACFTRFGGPSVVVDFGTAATFDCITKKGEYAGGIIVPGPVLASESLALRTAKLPRVEIAKPAHLIGKNTVESIQSGLYYGYVSLVDGILDHLRGVLGGSLRIAATGGLAGLIAGGSRHIHKENVFPDLTLEGLRILWERNQGRPAA